MNQGSPQPGELRQPTQKVVFKDEAHKSLLEGADILTEAVSSTMGPSGHSVIMDSEQGVPSITKDGVTVARSINLRDRLQSMGAELMKEIASKTNDLAGDGPQPLHAKVLTPSGWTTMGELQPGDIICGTNNTTQTVLGVFPKGKRTVYEVTTSDGRTVECCKDHLWSVKTYYGKSKILTTQQLLKEGLHKVDSKGDKRTKFYLPNNSVEYTTNPSLPLDPYLVGALLGDGYLPNTKRNNIEISIGLHEEFILDKMILPEGCGFTVKPYHNKNYLKVRFVGVGSKRKPILKNMLADLGLLGLNSNTKFIPKCYLQSSIHDRERLLSGLLDTDGHYNKRGLFEFNTVSKQLHTDFVALCRSLGKQIHSYKVDRKSGSAFGTKTLYKVVEIKGYKHGLKIEKIAATNRRAEMRCIKVSNADHLYVTNDFVVTHNTTTATVVGHALLKEGIKQIATGRSAIHLKQGMDDATEAVVKFLKENCIEVSDQNDIINVGAISSNGDKEIGQLIADAIDKVGRDGIITIEPAKSVQTTLNVVEGMQLNNGYVSPFFVTNSEKATCELEDPYVLVTTGQITSIADIMKPLEKVANSGRPLLIIADEIQGDALHTLIVNHMKDVVRVCAIKAPSYGEHRADILDDLSKVIGGEVFGATSEVGLNKAGIEHLGQAKKVIVRRNSTVIVGDPSDESRKAEIDSRVKSLRNSLENDTSLDELRISKYKERLARLSGGIAVIRVGGSTEIEIAEKKDRVEDAVNATMAASQEGIVPGGGVALFYGAQFLKSLLEDWQQKNGEDHVAGAKIIAEACEMPLKTIVRNTGESSDVVSQKLRDIYDEQVSQCVHNMTTEKGEKVTWINPIQLDTAFRKGYNALERKFTDLITTGIIDPVKVTRYSLEHASSVVGLMLTCNAVIVNEEQEHE